MEPPKNNLRSGFTTGACAAATTKAALLALIDQRPVTEVAIRLPTGTVVAFALHACAYTGTEGTASLIKDAGDDPDVTHGAEICARVRWGAGPGVTYRRGVGVGLVTKKGLPVPPGEPAINPAPRRLIAETVAEVLSSRRMTDRGVVVEIAVPRGEELARKTFNPRLGIVGGISILGTTGIVVPYSTAAWVASVTQEIDVAAAQGLKQLVLTVGARGERLARSLFPLPEEAFVQIGPFFGDALRHCARAGIERVILAAMIGKLAKFAAGNESVHSTSSSQDFAFLAETARAAGARAELAERIRRANTAQEAADMVAADGPREFFSLLCRKAWDFAVSIGGRSLALEVCLTGQAGGLLDRYSGPLPAVRSGPY
jgi:cobalt-precorrin-5B (C1)-methyltransferase